jgi:outer membrane protein insertion porin family/translocation and assembly module TamA
MSYFTSIAVVFLVLVAVPVHALRVEDLDPENKWATAKLVIEGNSHFSTTQLRGEMVTTTRSWYIPWRARPQFDSVAFRTDIERLQRFYRAQGYYAAQVTYELEVEKDSQLVTARISIEEGEPVIVSRVVLDVIDEPPLTASMEETLRSKLVLAEGGIFTEEHYQEAEAQIKAFLLDLHRGRAKVERKATVILEQHQADVQYAVEAGPVTVFGDTTIEGTKQVDPKLVARELKYQPGEVFSATAVNDSRKNILNLDLFSSVRFIQEDSPGEPRIIPMRVQVTEKPFREWEAGIGFGTEDEVRGQVRWRHNNWLGDGRRLDVQVRASSLVRNIDVSFVQPHALGPANRFTLTFRPQQLDEPGYLLNMTRLQPRFERDFTPQLSGFLGYRLEYDQLNDVTDATARVLREFQRKGALSGISSGFVWNTVDDPLNATRGGLLSFTAEQVGGALGGDFELVKFFGEARGYYLIAPKTVLASRLRLGFADPSGKSKEIPLFERFFAGGISSVRGYGRHRLGLISDSDDPVGGRSLLEGSLEVRRQLTEQIGGTLFLDYGQVSLKSFDVPVDDLKFAAGFGVLYTTPIGPLLLALGFPFDPPHGDQPWQVHFSIGQFF